MFEELVGRKIIVRKKDGFTKVGVLAETNMVFVVIEKDGGKKEYIAIDSIETVSEASA